jgi:CheY-like chemotaxis protein
MTENHILHIEDNFHNRRIVRKILEKQGYILHEAADGIIGFNMIQEFNPPMVLLDISLPGMDGIEIAQKVKAEDDLKHIILIALTASAMQGDRERFLAAGCDDYLSKPFRSIDLIEMINQHFADLPEKSISATKFKEIVHPIEEQSHAAEGVAFTEPSEKDEEIPIEESTPEESSEEIKITSSQTLEVEQRSEEVLEEEAPELDAPPEGGEVHKTASLQAIYSPQPPEELGEEKAIETDALAEDEETLISTPSQAWNKNLR